MRSSGVFSAATTRMQSAGSRGAKRAANALLEVAVLEAVELVAPAEARVHGDLLLRVLDRVDALDDSRERRLQAAQRLAKGAVRAAGDTRLGRALHLDLILARIPALDGESHLCTATTMIAVASVFSVARGSRIFQPKLINWS